MILPPQNADKILRSFLISVKLQTTMLLFLSLEKKRNLLFACDSIFKITLNELTIEKEKSTVIF